MWSDGGVVGQRGGGRAAGGGSISSEAVTGRTTPRESPLDVGEKAEKREREKGKGGKAKREGASRGRDGQRRGGSLRDGLTQLSPRSVGQSALFSFPLACKSRHRAHRSAKQGGRRIVNNGGRRGKRRSRSRGSARLAQRWSLRPRQAIIGKDAVLETCRRAGSNRAKGGRGVRRASGWRGAGGGSRVGRGQTLRDCLPSTFFASPRFSRSPPYSRHFFCSQYPLAKSF